MVRFMAGKSGQTINLVYVRKCNFWMVNPNDCHMNRKKLCKCKVFSMRVLTNACIRDSYTSDVLWYWWHSHGLSPDIRIQYAICTQICAFSILPTSAVQSYLLAFSSVLFVMIVSQITVDQFFLISDSVLHVRWQVTQWQSIKDFPDDPLYISRVFLLLSSHCIIEPKHTVLH
jgi:hypothetical protein